MLEKEGLILRKKETNATFFKATMSSEFRALKVAHTVSLMEERGIVDFINGSSSRLTSILLYGSAAKGEDGPMSDYDFLVIASKCDADMLELGERLGRECSLQSYTLPEWKNVSRKNRAFYLEVISGSVSLKGQKPVID